MSLSRWISVGLLACAVLAGAKWALERQTARALQQEIALLKDDNRALARLRAENERLRAEQVPAEELLRLQSDRAAIQRLRAEIEALKTRTEQRARDVTAPPALASSTPEPVPALVLKLGMDTQGGLSLDGNPTDLAQLKARLAALRRGDYVQIRLGIKRLERNAGLQEVDRGADALLALAKELGLKMDIRTDASG